MHYTMTPLADPYINEDFLPLFLLGRVEFHAFAMVLQEYFLIVFPLFNVFKFSFD